MTLRHYRRALAAATGAALLCVSLAAPSLAAPHSDTGDAALTTASATDEESAPNQRRCHAHRCNRRPPVRR